MTSTTTPSWEPVHHVSNYYDVPLEGLADFAGVPHLFFYHAEVIRRSSVDTLAPASTSASDAAPTGHREVGQEESDENASDGAQIDRIYSLVPLPSNLVAQSQEKHAIFERWHQAWSQDSTRMKYHPALPADKARYAELSTNLNTWLTKNRPGSALLKRGQFQCDRASVLPGFSRWTHFQVLWSDLSDRS